MSQIILDFGSGNTCQNDKEIVKQMYDELQKIDTKKHSVIIKWQLFESAGDNIPLQQSVFDFAYTYGEKLGYLVTSSVFDLPSLSFLLNYDIPFVKIANRRDLDWLIKEVPRKIPIYVSVDKAPMMGTNFLNVEKCLACISKYPASLEDYEDVFGAKDEMFPLLNRAVSDHTSDFVLWYKYQPKIIEWHYKLSNSVGLDASSFARSPEQLKEII